MLVSFVTVADEFMFPFVTVADELMLTDELFSLAGCLMSVPI